MSLKNAFKKLNLSEKLTGLRGSLSRFVNSAQGIRERTSETTTLLRARFPKSLEDLKKIQPDKIMDRMRELAGGRSYGSYLRLGAAAFAAYFLADTVSLFTASLIPDAPPVPVPVVVRRDEKHRSSNEYDAIISRNIFNSQGLIPDPEIRSSVAVRTSLPLNLIGTVVLKDERKSIATIEDRSINSILPVRVDDVVSNRIKIVKIEHLKVTFENLVNNTLEYVEIVEDLPANMRVEAHSAARPAGKKAEGVTAVSDTQFQIESRVIRDGMSNLNEVLQQARAIPNFENGVPDGYKILQIVPGSIFDKLGIKNDDVVVGLNGEPVNDPGKALALLNDLPNANHVEIAVKRKGRKMNMSYDIK